MKHMKFADIAAQITDLSDDNRPRRRVGNTCMLRLVDAVDPVIAEMVKASISDASVRLSDEIDDSIDTILVDREAIHGKCPDMVRSAMRSELLQYVGGYLLCEHEIADHVPLPNIPEKGTESRKAYDKWMRSKPNKEEGNA